MQFFVLYSEEETKDINSRSRSGGEERNTRIGVLSDSPLKPEGEPFNQEEQAKYGKKGQMW